MRFFAILKNKYKTTLNPLLKNQQTELIIFIKMCIFLCIMFFFLKITGILECHIAYAEGHSTETKTTTETVAPLENYTSEDTMARFVKTEFHPLALQNKLGIPKKSNNGMPDLTYLAIIGCDLELHKIKSDALFMDLTQYLEEKHFVLTEAYVGDTECFNAIRYQYHKDLITEQHDQLLDTLKKNLDGQKKILGSTEINIDTINTQHKHVNLEYLGPNNEKFVVQHTITTTPLTIEKFQSTYLGKNIHTDYLHACNSPFIELAKKERDSFVQIIPNGVSIDQSELLNYKHHFGKKILALRDMLELQVSPKKGLPNNEAAVEFLKNTLSKDKNLKNILILFKLIPKNIHELTMAHVFQLSSLSEACVHGIVHDSLMQIPKTKLTNEAQPVFENIINQLKNKKITPPICTYNIPNIQFDPTPKNYVLNANSMLYAKTSNYPFYMKSIARLQQLM